VALKVVPSTQWVSVRGNHPGALIEVRRVTPTAIYYRTIREGAGTGPRHRRGGPKNRLGHDEFLLNYRPNTKRDWMLASAPNGTPDEGKEPVTPTDLAASGRLHEDEEAIAQAIRDGEKYHDVQAKYHVQGRVLAQIIEKFGVPYETVRQKTNARREPGSIAIIVPVTDDEVLAVETPGAVVPTPTEPIPDGPLHPQEDEIVELMRARAGTFQDVLRDYHVKSSTLVAIMARHGIPKQTDDEKRAKSRAYYYRAKERKAQDEAARLAQEQEAATVVPEAAPTPSAPVVAIPTPVAEVVPGQHTWRVIIRTELVVTLEAANYLAAGDAVLAQHPGAEVISLARADS
jgi:hypothetical protein